MPLKSAIHCESQISGLIIGLEGLALLKKERTYLSHPAVAGVILFQRNYESPSQLSQLNGDIHQINPALSIGVDQEGGRVQRFRAEFTKLPSFFEIGAGYEKDPPSTLHLATQTAKKMAQELTACGVTLCFSPVADLYHPKSRVIKDRAFHQNPWITAALVTAYYQGMSQGGIAAVAKHFPGHGSVLGDTHVETVQDNRSFEAIAQADLLPFQALITQGISGIMMAHVSYPSVDSEPAGFSQHWIQTVLKKNLHFKGLVYSDDLGMSAAQAKGRSHEIIQLAQQAGCDRLLLCNEFEVIAHLLEKSST